jgi:hypothetical protein
MSKLIGIVSKSVETGKTLSLIIEIFFELINSIDLMYRNFYLLI